ncbi:MAG TPA: amidohydrolase family protein [Gemmatimonadaceae bacterium]|nr:amidohydrolase family protein [Gemmatimonadaceae bacterium]
MFRISKRTMRFTPVVVAVLVGVACTSNPAVTLSAGTPLDGNSFVIRNVRVFDGSHAIERSNVVVRSGLIASVGRSMPAGLPVIDGSGRTLLPGFIDTHGHVGNEGALRNALRFGVTTVLDMLTSIDAVRPLKARRTRMDRTDLADLYTAGSPITSPRGLGTQFGIPFTTISAPGEAPTFVKGRISEGSDYIKILYEPGAPLFTTISRETLSAVVAAAHAEGVLALVHVSSVEGARDAVRAGADGLAHSFGDSLIEDALAKEIAARSVFVTPTLSIFAAFQRKPIGPALAADSRLSPYLTAAQRTGLTSPGPGPEHPMAPYLVRFDVDRASENVRRMKAAGVRILSGTDAPNLGSHGVSLHGELELLTKAGLSPAEALTAATLAPAQAFKLSDRGQIKAGMRADLVLVEGDPTQNIEMTRAIVRIFKNGYEVSRSLPLTAPSASQSPKT